jgi:hypothetical protein
MKVFIMRLSLRVSILVFGVVWLAACSSEPAADGAVTETKMDSVDAVQGTISDEMIVTDDSSEQAPMADSSEAPAEPAKGVTAATSDKKAVSKPKPAVAAKPAAPKSPDESPAE